ncbi:hypothetical protein MITS9509_00513 [Synechococcus sp. MIT S9509]|nr:hypothetical protein MITS9504_00134 [Synechococcus sp. MIT S9504]KZR93220.1 hypothetical protein MITS9509_00513 [Synechococcus sp. MIT S9509]
MADNNALMAVPAECNLALSSATFWLENLFIAQLLSEAHRHPIGRLMPAFTL